MIVCLLPGMCRDFTCPGTACWRSCSRVKFAPKSWVTHNLIRCHVLPAVTTRCKACMTWCVRVCSAGMACTCLLDVCFMQEGCKFDQCMPIGQRILERQKGGGKGYTCNVHDCLLAPVLAKPLLVRVVPGYLSLQSLRARSASSVVKSGQTCCKSWTWPAT